MPHSNPPPGWHPRDSHPPAGPLRPPAAPPKRRRPAVIMTLGLLAALIALALTSLLITIIDPGDAGTKDRDGENPPAATPVTVASRSQAPPSPAPSSRAPSSRAPEPRGEPDRGPVHDVKIDSCGVDPTTRWPSAGLTITNSGERTSTYIASIEFLGPTGTRLAEGAGISNSLAPGQRAEVTAGGVAQLTEDEITCKVIKVDRIAP